MDIQSIKSSQTQNINSPKVIDSEWLQLIVEAKEIGLSIEDIRTYFEKQQTSKDQ